MFSALCTEDTTATLNGFTLILRNRGDFCCSEEVVFVRSGFQRKWPLEYYLWEVAMPSSRWGSGRSWPEAGGQLPSSCPFSCSRDTAAADTGPVYLHLLLVGPADGGYLVHQVVGVGVRDIVVAGGLLVVRSRGRGAGVGDPYSIPISSDIWKFPPLLMKGLVIENLLWLVIVAVWIQH